MIKIAYVECKGEQESDAKIEGILVCAPLPVVGILHLTAVGVVAVASGFHPICPRADRVHLPNCTQAQAPSASASHN